MTSEAVKREEAEETSSRNSRDSDSDIEIYLEEGEEEEYIEDDEEIDAAAQESEDRDKLLHWWCYRQLSRLLKRLSRFPEAGPFLEPLPWEELGLDDYPEVVEDPIDLKTMGERLNDGSYQDPDGMINPEFFWEDVFLCWENCMTYYEEDMEIEACKLAEVMRKESEKLEDEFWNDLASFEKALERVGGTALSSVATVADVAVTQLEDAAASAYQDTAELLSRAAQGAALWWQGLNAVPVQQPEEKKLKPRPKLIHGEMPKLRDHYFEIIDLRFKADVTDDLNEITAEVETGVCRGTWPSIPEESDLKDFGFPDELSFEGSDRKLPLQRLLPAKHLASALGILARPRRSITSQKSSRPASRSSFGSTYSRENSASVSRAASEHSMHSRRPSVSSQRGAVPRTPRGHRGSECSNSTETSRDNQAAARAAARALRQVQGAPGVESSSEDENDSKTALTSVGGLKNVFQRRRGSVKSTESTKPSTQPE
eukprot:TRINITY_DN12500_c0_g1_i2.p1 TRINITY_DN12500_c0_g1~~TRINITY_DN12500_c0_g1_i2.p1  ORF type:complete len:485 (-),score=110.59 TRINITY_DN12500_c0_g1_i2:209-1663(-)